MTLKGGSRMRNIVDWVVEAFGPALRLLKVVNEQRMDPWRLVSHHLQVLGQDLVVLLIQRCSLVIVFADGYTMSQEPLKQVLGGDKVPPPHQLWFHDSSLTLLEAASSFRMPLLKLLYDLDFR